MESIKNKFLNHQHRGFFPLLIGVLIIFLIALTISTIVGIQNKIKEGKYIGQEIETKNTITVSDRAEVYAKPDLALTTFSVKTEAKTVAQAMADNTEKMNKIISFMKDSDIEEKDLKTTTFNIYPRYEYRRVEVPPYPSGKRVLVGYEVTQSLQVKIRDLEKIGQIIQGATDRGANQVGNLQFTIDKPDELKKQAREEAIKKAKAKAEELAKQLGVNLVRITNFSESVPTTRFVVPMAAEAIGIGGGEETPEIETGENKIEVAVTITYEIN